MVNLFKKLEGKVEERPHCPYSLTDEGIAEIKENLELLLIVYMVRTSNLGQIIPTQCYQDLIKNIRIYIDKMYPDTSIFANSIYNHTKTQLF